MEKEKSKQFISPENQNKKELLKKFTKKQNKKELLKKEEKQNKNIKQNKKSDTIKKEDIKIKQPKNDDLIAAILGK